MVGCRLLYSNLAAQLRLMSISKLRSTSLSWGWLLNFLPCCHRAERHIHIIRYLPLLQYFNYLILVALSWLDIREFDSPNNRRWHARFPLAGFNVVYGFSAILRAPLSRVNGDMFQTWTAIFAASPILRILRRCWSSAVPSGFAPPIIIFKSKSVSLSSSVGCSVLCEYDFIISLRWFLTFYPKLNTIVVSGTTSMVQMQGFADIMKTPISGKFIRSSRWPVTNPVKDMTRCIIVSSDVKMIDRSTARAVLIMVIIHALGLCAGSSRVPPGFLSLSTQAPRHVSFRVFVRIVWPYPV